MQKRGVKDAYWYWCSTPEDERLVVNPAQDANCSGEDPAGQRLQSPDRMSLVPTERSGRIQDDPPHLGNSAGLLASTSLQSWQQLPCELVALRVLRSGVRTVS